MRAGRKGNEAAARLRAAAHAAALREAVALYEEGRYADAALRANAVLTEDAGSAGAMHLLGRIALVTGANEIARGMLTRALALLPRSVSILLDYGRLMGAEGRRAEAVSAFRKAIALRPDSAEAHCALGAALLDEGKREEALAEYRKALAARPGHGLAAHMVARLTGTATGADEDYVAGLFDSYAGNFDKHLTGTLEYRVPELVAEAVARHATGPIASGLDIGCGTGLVATALKDRVIALDGIDLSEKMVEAARAKGLYRRLAAGDAVAVMGETQGFSGPYDLVVAGDVFVYFGDLAPVFAAVRARLAPGGLFVFSVEHAETGEIELRSSGRTAHGEGYIARLAAEAGFITLDVTPADLRKERNHPIAGRLTVLRTPA